MDNTLSTGGYVANGIYDNIRGGYGNASAVGSGALFTAYDGKETREQVRKEGDQSSLRDGFAAASLERKSDRSDAAIAALTAVVNSNAERTNDKIAASQLEAAKCCCDTKLMIAASEAKIISHMDANTIDELRAKLSNTQSCINHANTSAASVGSMYNLGSTFAQSTNSGVQGVATK